jgi:Rrf2 family protein
MRITSKGEYAARAVLYLTLKHPEVVPIQEIAERHNIPLKYLEQILLTLRNAGVLRSRRGIKGGYQLNRPAERITVGEVLRTVDGDFARGGCPDRDEGKAPVCPDVQTCGLTLLWREVTAAVEKIVDGTTFADLHKRTRAAMDAHSNYTYNI